MTPMFRTVVDAWIATETLDAQTVYGRLQPLVRLLQDVHPAFHRWIEHSRSNGVIPYSDEERFVQMLASHAEQDGQEFPDDPDAGGAGANLTTAMTAREWKTPGRASIEYYPWVGRLTMTIFRPIEAFSAEGATSVVRQCVAALSTAMVADHVARDVVCPLETGKGYETYYANHRLFPHRRWLGWMGFVPHLVPRKFIPEAASMEVVKGKGTMIVALDEPFDLRNPEHLRRVHQVELRMANAGLLDITDPTLLE
ncbi:Imm52 family immunity protein [Stenotrophomonas maltophilia]